MLPVVVFQIGSEY